MLPTGKIATSKKYDIWFGTADNITWKQLNDIALNEKKKMYENSSDSTSLKL